MDKEKASSSSLVYYGQNLSEVHFYKRYLPEKLAQCSRTGEHGFG